MLKVGHNLVLKMSFYVDHSHLSFKSMFELLSFTFESAHPMDLFLSTASQNH